MRYRILVDGSYKDATKRKVPLNQAQIDNYKFQVGRIFDEILSCATGQVILEGIHSSGWVVIVTPHWGSDCNHITVGRSRSRFNPIKEVLIGQGYQYLLNAG